MDSPAPTAERPRHATPADELTRLRKINQALMNRVERSTDMSGSAFNLFRTAISLENEVQIRTRDLNAALEELHKTNQRLRATHLEAEIARRNLTETLEAVEEGFALFDADDTLVLCNERFRTLLPDRADAVRPGMAFAAYAEVISTSAELDLPPRSQPADWVAFRINMHGKPHATFTVALRGDRWIQVSERQIAAGGTAIIQTNVTEMVRRERRERDKILDAQARHARATLDHMSEGVCTFDRRLHLIDCNARFCELLKLPKALTRPGTPVYHISRYMRGHGELSSDLPAITLARWVGKRIMRAPVSAEYRRHDGTIVNISMRDMPDQGFVISFSDVTNERQAVAALRETRARLERDIAERTKHLTAMNRRLTRKNDQNAKWRAELRHAKEAAEAVNRSKSRFLAAASHDLLQPINAAKLFIANLVEMPLRPDQRRVMGRLASAFQSIEALLRALLELSRLDAGGAKFERQNFPIGDILAPLAVEFEAVAAAGGLRLRFVPCRQVVVSDPYYFRRIVQNLVANAVHYTRAGTVLVGCRRRGDHLRVEVWDTGPGLEAPDHERIFEEFQRVDIGATRSGVGLGLSIVKRSCHLLGHAFGVRSWPGRGSVFWVEAPRVPAATTVAGAGAGFPLDPRGGLNLLAVLVENNLAERGALASVLERWGVSVIAAASTADALAQIAEIGLAPDIVIADFHLDGDDTGVLAMQRVRALWGAQIPAIVISADPAPEVAAEVRRMNADILPKPIEPRVLRALITWRGMAST